MTRLRFLPLHASVHCIRTKRCWGRAYMNRLQEAELNERQSDPLIHHFFRKLFNNRKSLLRISRRHKQNQLPHTQLAELGNDLWLAE